MLSIVTNSVYLLLAENGGGYKDGAYEIIIGNKGNTETTIRRYNSEQSITLDTPGILSCSKLGDFWVSWKDGHVQFGFGYYVGDYKIIDFIDQDGYHTPVRFISATSVGAVDTTSRWHFDEPRRKA